MAVKPLDTDSLQLHFSHLGYVQKSVLVANRIGDGAYTLQAKARQLEKVELAKLPVHKRKDTVNYEVGAFVSPEDRVIADIIRKLPGIEIENNVILYQGKPIQKYMVNNLDLNVTPMTFGKTFQMLNSFQTNNTGDDVARDLNSYYSGNSFFGNQSNIGEGPSYVAVRNVSSPGFDEKKWLDNRIFLFSTNVLQKLRDGLEIKGNISYHKDTRDRKGFTATQYFTGEDILVSRETVSNRYHIDMLDAGALIEKNEQNIYLRNYLKYRQRWNQD